MLDDRACRAACAFLTDLADSGALGDLPEELTPSSRAEGYAVQKHIAALRNDSVCGWKIAATSRAGQAHINVDGPLAGRILAGTVHENGATISLAGNHMRAVELEFAFRMGKKLPPRAEPYTREEALDAVASLHPSMEIPDSRYERFTEAGAAKLIADNACGKEFLFGPEAPGDWRALDLAEYAVTGRVNGKNEFHGKGSNVLGDPVTALAWLVNELSRHGIPLAAGQFVSTGTCLSPIAVSPGDAVLGDFGLLGRLEARFV